jgi:hypothetical protein
MNKHTPGPWWFSAAEEGYYVAGVGDKELTNLIQKEDARLIAAAPELLEALKMSYAETMEYIKTNHLSGAENNSWLVLARAAIAKATGETE